MQGYNTFDNDIPLTVKNGLVCFYDGAANRFDGLRLALNLLTIRSIFAVTLPLVRSNSWDAQLAVPNDPRYARLETNLGIRQAKERY
ncbi:hypothetical protein TNCV_2016451 [Trichonephila clavipes]|nr:hypothetical protein TNCV_2016451 [Trichonephila clavipes]